MRTRTLREMDKISADIHRLWKSSPSRYTVGKRHLAEARAMLESDPRAALRAMRKGRRTMIRESAVMAGFNPVADAVALTDDPSVVRDAARLRECLERGEWRAARRIVRRLRLHPAVTGLEPTVEIRTGGRSDEGVELVIANTGNRTLLVADLRVSADGIPLDTVPPHPYSIPPRGSRTILCLCGREVRVSVDATLEYEDQGHITRTVRSVLALEG